MGVKETFTQMNTLLPQCVTTKVEDAPAKEQVPAHAILAEDDVVEIHAGTEDLD